MKILIVDDDEIARISLSNILSHAGAEIVQAEDGEQAWALLEGGLRPAACCSDVVMPHLDGLGLLARARGHMVLKDLPFVLISSAADRSTVETAIAHGVAGYILKPFLAVQTRATVDRVVRERRAARSEHFLVTRRRLDVSLERLEQMLALFRTEAQTLAQAMAQGPAPEHTGELQRLHGSSLLLGLWKVAAFLSAAMGVDVSPADRLLAVREAEMLVEDQLEDLTQLAPAA
ncbi:MULTISPECIES: response regulator [Ramlibacter]|uniref:Response regulator n=1 Tax=Ramlibacter aquaticus TaxID=2780094 RepID=A0ABR9SGS7_9BURK|nr:MULTISPECIES: response regulator [Ramlibacter]MBE7941551.1 response regulator [Ramlibacter aquaticus]